MQPIRFACSTVIPATAPEICAAVADVSRWPEFKGYGPLPGIAQAEYEVRTPAMVGSRVRVRNTDGSSHREEIYQWQPEEQISLKLYDFSPPLDRLATHFLEEWYFTRQTNGTQVVRSFQLFPRQPLARPLVWLIARLFKRAIARQLAELAVGTPREA